MAEGNTWYFYSRTTQNRMTSNGYWQPIGIEEPVMNSSGNNVGIKKYFVFFVGEAPSGIKTNWTMQEYGLSDSAASTSTTRSSSKRRGHSKIVKYLFLFFIWFFSFFHMRYLILLFVIWRHFVFTIRLIKHTSKSFRIDQLNYQSINVSHYF